MLIDNALQGLMTHKIETVKLWENANPSGIFTGQTLKINSMTEYIYLIILVRGSKLHNTLTPFLMFKTKDYRTENYTLLNKFNTSYIHISSRTYNISSDSIIISDCTNKNANAGNSSVDNSYHIPYVIYGVKGKMAR